MKEINKNPVVVKTINPIEIQYSFEPHKIVGSSISC